MRPTFVIAAREVRNFFVSPIAYIVLTVWTLYCGYEIYLYANFFAARALQGDISHSSSDNLLSWFFGGNILFYVPLLVFVPVITMRLIAEEKRSGTIEALLTAPITGASVVIGKYLASLIFWIAMWIPTGLYVWILSNYGDVDLGIIGASYLGVFGVGVHYMAIGVLMSAISNNQITAALLTFMTLVLLFLIGIAEGIFPESRELLSYINVYNHMLVSSKGIIDSRSLIYDASITTLAIFLAVLALTSLRGSAQSTLGGLSRRAIGSLLLAGILFMVNYLSFRHYERWDWTEAGQFTMSERTEQVARNLDREVSFYVFLSEGEYPLYDDTRELLERYRALSPHITTHFVDPRRDREQYEILLERFRVRESGDGLVDTAVIVDSGERNFRVRRDQLSQPDLDSFGEDDAKRTVNVEAERAFTAAILEVIEGDATKVCAASGHGEWPVDASNEMNLYAILEIGRLDNFEVEAIELNGHDDIDESCDALLIAGPTRFFEAASVDRVREYLDQGGNVMMALEPILMRDEFQPTGFEELVAEYGILIDASLVAERDESSALSPTPVGLFLVREYGEHPVVEGLKERQAPIVLAGARTLRQTPGSLAQVLFQGSAASYGETDVDAILEAQFEVDTPDVEGPAILALVAEPEADEEDGEEETGGRLIVVGDTDWLAPEFLGAPDYGNAFLISTTLGYLTEREAMISIPPRPIDAMPIVITEGDLTFLGVRVMVLIPAAIVLIGFAAWWARRR